MQLQILSEGILIKASLTDIDLELLVNWNVKPAVNTSRETASMITLLNYLL